MQLAEVWSIDVIELISDDKGTNDKALHYSDSICTLNQKLTNFHILLKVLYIIGWHQQYNNVKSCKCVVSLQYEITHGNQVELCLRILCHKTSPQLGRGGDKT